MAAVFSMQGIGQLSAAIVALIVTVAFKQSFIGVANAASCDYACQVAADRSWRIIVAAGGVPACIALYYRATIPETPRYTFDVAFDVEKADADIKAYMASKSEGVVDPIHHAKMMKAEGPPLAVPSASWPDAFSYFGQWKNFKVLFGTTFSWFFLVSRQSPSSITNLFALLIAASGPCILRPGAEQLHRPPRHWIFHRSNSVSHFIQQLRRHDHTRIRGQSSRLLDRHPDDRQPGPQAAAGIRIPSVDGHLLHPGLRLPQLLRSYAALQLTLESRAP